MAASLISFLVLSLCTLSAFADDVFVSIDCGSTSSEEYKDENLIVWKGDDGYIKNGEAHTVPSANSRSRVMDTLRAFTTRRKNCYFIDNLRRGRVLVRASFYYGNYDQKSSPPSFDLHFDGNFWVNVSTSSSDYVDYEVIYTMKRDNISVCVAQTQANQFPFVSALEIRVLEPHMYSYINDTLPLFKMSRYVYGANSTIRYSDDPYDRIWTPSAAGAGLTTLYSNNVISNPGLNDIPPPVALRNAISPINTNSSLILNTGFPPFVIPVYINLFFSEVAQLQVGQRRIFRIFMNNTPFQLQIMPPPGNFTQIYLSNFLVSANTTLSLVATNISTLPPLINAMEVYMVGSLLTNGTNAADVNGLASLQKSFEVLQGWRGDPCLPPSFSWDWINCSSDPTPRVTALHLGSFGLSGALPDFSSMDRLVTIDLRNNSLTGPIPAFLGTLPNLKELNLQNNRFNGTVPSSLSQRSGMNLVVTGNPDLCSSGDNSCRVSPATPNNARQKYSNLPVLMVATIFSLIILC